MCVSLNGRVSAKRERERGGAFDDNINEKTLFTSCLIIPYWQCWQLVRSLVVGLPWRLKVMTVISIKKQVQVDRLLCCHGNTSSYLPSTWSVCDECG